MKETIWNLYRCESGFRWTSVERELHPDGCHLSGCDCRNAVIHCGTTSDVREATEWTRFPNPDSVQFDVTVRHGTDEEFVSTYRERDTAHAAVERLNLSACRQGMGQWVKYLVLTRDIRPN